MQKEKVVKYIKSKPMLYYAYKCLRGMKNKEFMLDVLRMNECDLVLNFKKYGNLYPEKNVYYIKTDSDVRGFFSMFCLVLDALVIADRYHLSPVVEFGTHTLYYQGIEINGSKNPFEYYFQQVSQIDISEVTECSRVLLYRDGQRNVDYNEPYSVASQQISNGDDAYIKSRALVCKKYLKLNPVVKEYIDRNVFNILGSDRVLGIHVRGTDFNKGYLNHAKAVTEEQYIEATDLAIKKEKYKKIFLATDEQKIITLFKKHYGQKMVCYEDVLRSLTGEALHFCTAERKNHKYLLGLEVLRDMMTLSACDGLIAGFSNVSLAARIMKASNAENYSYINIIDNGFNTTGVRFEKSRQLKKNI